MTTCHYVRFVTESTAETGGGGWPEEQRYGRLLARYQCLLYNLQCFSHDLIAIPLPKMMFQEATRDNWSALVQKRVSFMICDEKRLSPLRMPRWVAEGPAVALLSARRPALFDDHFVLVPLNATHEQTCKPTDITRYACGEQRHWSLLPTRQTSVEPMTWKSL